MFRPRVELRIDGWGNAALATPPDVALCCTGIAMASTVAALAEVRAPARASVDGSCAPIFVTPSSTRPRKNLRRAGRTVPPVALRAADSSSVD